MVLSLRDYPTMVVWDKFMERFSEPTRKLIDQLVESLKQACQNFKPKHIRRVLICGYAEEDDCVCVATETMESEDDDIDDVVVVLEEEIGYQSQLQTQQVGDLSEHKDENPIAPEVENCTDFQAQVEASNSSIHPVRIKLIHDKVTSFPYTNFSSPSLSANTVIGTLCANKKELIIANEVFDKSPQRKGYMIALNPEPLDDYSPIIRRPFRALLDVGLIRTTTGNRVVGLSKVSIQYYMKDEQKLQPSEAQNLSLTYAVLSLMMASAGVAITDVTMDACVTENSISHPSLAGDMQSLGGLSSFIGALIGFSVSGFHVHIIGSKGVFGVLSIPSGLVILVGMILREPLVRNSGYRRVNEKIVDAGKAMWTALKCGDVWRPCLYMYLSLAFSLNVHEGMFYWYTDAKAGPSFSKEVIGSIFSVGAVGSFFGVLLYQNIFKNYPFRQLLFWSQLLYGASGMLDLILVLRLNLRFGVPDFFFVVIDEFFHRMIGRLKWMPLLVLSSKLCPSGIEGTFFALLMSIDHVGMLNSSWAGGLFLHFLNISRTKFDNLWLAILIRSFLRILPIGLLFLVPASDPNVSIHPNEMLTIKKVDDTLDFENMELASLVDNT